MTDGSQPSDSTAPPRGRGRPRLPPRYPFRWCDFCGKTYRVQRAALAWHVPRKGFCSVDCHLSMEHFEGPMKPLPITGDSVTLEGSQDFPAFLALRQEPIGFPWMVQKVHPRWFRIKHIGTGAYFDVEGMEYANRVAERFNAIEYMRGARSE